MTASTPERFQQKRARLIAQSIENEITWRGWPVGETIGTEPEFLERLSVSRAVFREAVRLLEYRGTATMRRGRGGGLVVTAPADRQVLHAAVVMFTHMGVGLDELFEVRVSLESMAAQLAAERTDDSGADLLHELLASEHAEEGLRSKERHHTLHNAIAVLTQNAVLELFVKICAALTLELTDPETELSDPLTHHEIRRAHQKIAYAICGADPVTAAESMRVHLKAALRGVSSQGPEHRNRITGFHLTTAPSEPNQPPDQKLAATIAEQLRRVIVESDFDPGIILGTEPELVAKYGVSVSVFREAVRILEHQGIARMRWGPGGLVVTEPDSSSLVHIAALFLNYRHTPVADVELVEQLLLIEAVDLATSRAAEDPDRELRLDEELQIGSCESFHLAVARQSGNRVVELFCDVSQSLRLKVAAPKQERSTAESMRLSKAEHVLIAAAMMSGDTRTARRRMQQHLARLRSDYTASLRVTSQFADFDPAMAESPEYVAVTEAPGH
jgi:DNA-binding FadR family transcriptional regulator